MRGWRCRACMRARTPAARGRGLRALHLRCRRESLRRTAPQQHLPPGSPWIWCARVCARARVTCLYARMDQQLADDCRCLRRRQLGSETAGWQRMLGARAAAAHAQRPRHHEEHSVPARPGGSRLVHTRGRPQWLRPRGTASSRVGVSVTRQASARAPPPRALSRVLRRAGDTACLAPLARGGRRPGCMPRRPRPASRIRHRGPAGARCTGSTHVARGAAARPRHGTALHSLLFALLLLRHGLRLAVGALERPLSLRGPRRRGRNGCRNGSWKSERWCSWI